MSSPPASLHASASIDSSSSTTTSSSNSSRSNVPESTMMTNATASVSSTSAAAASASTRMKAISNRLSMPTTSASKAGEEDRWQPQADWSIAPGPNEHGKHNDGGPILTSQRCYDGLAQFFRDVFASQDDDQDNNADDVIDDDDDDGYGNTPPAIRGSHGHAHGRRHRHRKYRAKYDPLTLAVATEASSHLAGLEAVYGQPWFYGGGGLGNMDECPTNDNLQVCLAGGTGRDSLTFASVCIVQECAAEDLLAEDFVERLETASFHVSTGSKQLQDREHILDEYIALHRRVAEVGKFLGTGWVCGEYKVDWEVFPTTLYSVVVAACIILSLLGTFWVPKFIRRRQQIHEQDHCQKEELHHEETVMTDTTTSDYVETRPPSQDSSERSTTRSSTIETNSYDVITPFSISILNKYVLGQTANDGYTNDRRRNFDVDDNDQEKIDESLPPFWSAWNTRVHLKRLVMHRPETACLDGLKVGSILWIIAAHVMAIQSSTGAGYLNPKDFLPPNGITTTLIGQLLFSSRFAVDTFLCISGYLAMYVLRRKLSRRNKRASRWDILTVLLLRVLRILPLYIFCLGFWMFIAPHLGSGPFWYQWENFLEPCRHSWWTNLLFVNNFLPWGVSTTANCFYHSWYLAVDVQLFFLFSPWLVILYQRSTKVAICCTMFLWAMSVVVTAVLSYTQMWSVNTFDGAQVALFDVEGYAKPHVRAQSYLAGILVAMWPTRRDMNFTPVRRPPESSLDSQSQTQILKIRSWLRYSDTWLTILCLTCLTFLSFVTVTGAYSRRACTFDELPAYNDCGSLWSPTLTFLYTAFSRAVWSICIASLMYLCLEDGSQSTSNDNDDTNSNLSRSTPQSQPSQLGYATAMVKSVLSWKLWTPLAHLSFGAYLIHPIVIFVWKLGGREKVTFRLSSFVMDCCSISVVTFVLSLGTALIVEFPFQQLLVLVMKRKETQDTWDSKKAQKDQNANAEILDNEISPLIDGNNGSYGSAISRSEDVQQKAFNM